jgi:hypothetical protein
MHAPVPPTYRLEWEDAELSVTLSRHALQGWNPKCGWAPWLRNYMADRKAHAERFFGTHRFALKSPLLALVWGPLMEAAPGATIIRTTRPHREIEKSEARAFRAVGVERGREINARVGRALEPIVPHLSVHYPDLVREPAAVIADIVGLLDIGGNSAERIPAAVACVMEPTSS